MAVLIFSGGHTLRIPTPAAGAITSLRNADGYCPLTSGTETVHVNPAQVAYIVEDEAYDSTFGPGSVT